MTARMLWPVSLLFAGLVAWRRVLYRWGLLRSERLPVPVVVVGNLIVGGAGKTPSVMALVQLLRERGWHPGVISRGYGRVDDEVAEVLPDSQVADCGDEPLLIRLRTGAPVCVGRDRVAAAKALLARHAEVDVIVSDDGLQHLQLARDAQVVVFDERGAGNGWLLPAGPLREALTRRPPDRSVVVYNADAPSTPWPGHLAQRGLSGAVSLEDWRAGRPASAQVLQDLAHRPIVAAAGMGSPARFFGMLTQAGLRIDPLPLPDHFDFATLPWPAGTADVIVTEKDAVKLAPQRLGTTRLWVAPLDFRFDASFERELLDFLPAAPARNLHGQPIA